MSIDDILDKMEAAEKGFIGTEFFAPIIGGGQVAVRIAGVVCDVRVRRNLPSGFQGWAILRALSTRDAAFVREAGLGEIADYLELFPSVRLILVEQRDKYWLAFPAHRGDHRFQIQGPVALLLPEEGQTRFETVIARFDGRLFWYDARDPSRDPALASYLRDQLSHQDSSGLPPKPDSLHKLGLSKEERDAYAFAWVRLAREAKDEEELRISEALMHAGATLREYTKRDDAYVVTFQVEGRTHVTTVRQEDLTVLTAGICLGGQDQRFDLTSLVGVICEGEARGRLVWVGRDGLPEDHYWRIHPPEEEIHERPAPDRRAPRRRAPDDRRMLDLGGFVRRLRERLARRDR